VILEDVSLLQVVIPLAAAAIGAASVAAVARHLRRQELYVEAAQKINDYLDEAAEALNEMDPNEDFDVERVSQAKRAVSLAVFHSRRLESPEVTSRLQVANFVLGDMLTYEDRRGRLSAYRAIDDVMSAVVEFMILPRLWPPRKRFRKLPPNRFPNTGEHYQELVSPDDRERLNWPAVRKWVSQRERDLTAEQERN
jgi:hypothetical protein